MATSPSPFDPLERLEPGEDRFVIRERDPAGPGAITEWCRLRRQWAYRTYGVEPTGNAKRLLDAELAQCAEADAKALAWKERQTDGGPIEEHRATYTEATLSEEQVSAAKRQKLREDLIRCLREADYFIHELLDLDGPAASVDLTEQAGRLHELANDIEYGPGKVAA